MQIVFAALLFLLYAGVVVYALTLMARLVGAVERIARRLDEGAGQVVRFER